MSDIFPSFFKGREIFLRQRLVVYGSIPQRIDQDTQTFSLGHRLILLVRSAP